MADYRRFYILTNRFNALIWLSFTLVFRINRNVFRLLKIKGLALCRFGPKQEANPVLYGIRIDPHICRIAYVACIARGVCHLFATTQLLLPIKIYRIHVLWLAWYLS